MRNNEEKGRKRMIVWGKFLFRLLQRSSGMSREKVSASQALEWCQNFLSGAWTTITVEQMRMDRITYVSSHWFAVFVFIWVLAVAYRIIYTAVLYQKISKHKTTNHEKYYWGSSFRSIDVHYLTVYSLTESTANHIDNIVGHYSLTAQSVHCCLKEK